MNKELTLYFATGDIQVYTEGENCIKITDNRERDLPVVKVRFEDQVMQVFKGIPFKIKLVETERPENEDYTPAPARRPGNFFR